MLGQEKRRVLEIPLNRIRPNRAQPRQIFPEQELQELCRSIRQNGLIQPLTVRRLEGGFYELIAGERRLRACRMAGMHTVSCIVNNCSDKQSAVLAMTENLQRQDLQIFEEAEGIRSLIEQWGVTQEEAALRLGKSQSTIANKLRLLRLSETERKTISEAGLTERHARALLRLSDPAARERALKIIISRGLNVKQTDEFIETLMDKKKSRGSKTVVVKDVRIFMNTIQHAVRTMQMSGIKAQALKSETDEYFECVVRIPKAELATAKQAAVQAAANAG